MDRRESMTRWWSSFDESHMTATILGENDEGEEIEHQIPVEYEICGTCDGKGTHVNPSIDSHGISREEFDEDPDFEEAYHRGDYDTICNECEGRRVVPVPKEGISPELQKVVDDQYEHMREINTERDYRRRGYEF